MCLHFMKFNCLEYFNTIIGMVSNYHRCTLTKLGMKEKNQWGPFDCSLIPNKKWWNLSRFSRNEFFIILLMNLTIWKSLISLFFSSIMASERDFCCFSKSWSSIGRSRVLACSHFLVISSKRSRPALASASSFSFLKTWR